jgi:hypothetical protein
MNTVGDFLGTFSGIRGLEGLQGTESLPAKPLKRKQVMV